MRSVTAKPQSLTDVIRSLLEAMAARDEHFVPHAKAVQEIVGRMCEAMSVKDGTRQTLRVACLLHDVGQMRLRETVLNKQGPLDATELRHVQRHAVLSEQMVRSVLHDEAVCSVVRHHHERWDGTGYPDGLRGERIPLGARMLAVAEAFVSMTEHRPYRPAMSREEALGKIKALCGTQFSPQAVESLVRVTDSHAEPHENEPSRQPAGLPAVLPETALADNAECSTVPQEPSAELYRTIDRQMQQVAELRPLSAVASEVMAIDSEDEIRMEDLAQKIRYDPALVTKLLRVANCALYRGRTAIDSVEQAVVRLGLDRVREMVIALGVIDQWRTAESGRVLDLESFWRHSVAAALIAQRLARTCLAPNPDSIFTAALLHDIGGLVLQEAMGREYDRLFEDVRAKGICVSRAEETAMGVDHATAMYRVGRFWNLPESLLRLIAKHHTPWSEVRGIEAEVLRQIICLRTANILANAADGGRWVGGSLETVPKTHTSLLGLKDDALPALLIDVPEQIHALAEAYGLTLDNGVREAISAAKPGNAGYYVSETDGALDPFPYYLAARHASVTRTDDVLDWINADHTAWCWIRVASPAFAERTLRTVVSAGLGPARIGHRLLVLLPGSCPDSAWQEFGKVGASCLVEPWPAQALEAALDRMRKTAET